MHVEQAVYTSVRARRLSGYQLAATSPGVTAEEARELARWGPAHDSLNNDEAPECVNFHRLASGNFCISRTVAAGTEPSGRGQRIYTQSLLVSPRDFSAFDNHPLRLLDVAGVCGALQVWDDVPEQLDALHLFAADFECDLRRLENLVEQVTADGLAQLLDHAMSLDRLGILSPAPAIDVLYGLLSLMPSSYRSDLSFTSGLRYSARRPFRIIFLPKDVHSRRRLVRSAGCRELDLTLGRVAAQPVEHGWARLIADLFRLQRLTDLPDVMNAVRLASTIDLERAAQQMRQRLQLADDQVVV